MKLLSPIFILVTLLFYVTHATYAQSIAAVLKEAEILEIKLNENEALEKYQQLLLIDANNMKALVKCAELNANIGNRKIEKKEKQFYYQKAYSFAQKAINTNANDADANYAMAMVSGKMTEVETENKKIVAFVKYIKTFADKALQINLKHAKANYILGKWNIEIVNLSGLKKAAVKLLYGGLPDGTLENAILYMERCKQYDSYFMLNYLDLAKAYQQNNQPTKAIEVLQQLVKLPIRTSDDTNYKANAKQLLAELL